MGRIFGHAVSTKTRGKISQKLRGRKKIFSEQHKLNLSKALKGRKHTQECKDKISLAHKGKAMLSTRGNLHHNWKDQFASISAIHKWLRKRITKPIKCNICHKEKKLQLSSKTHQYSREMSEYQYLCFSCHRKWDIQHNNNANYLAMSKVNWKGNNATPQSILGWIKKRKPKPLNCEICHRIKPLDLSSKNRNFSRDFSEYQYICRSCRCKRDFKLGRISLTSARKKPYSSKPTQD
jgi:hypothetical protein